MPLVIGMIKLYTILFEQTSPDDVPSKTRELPSSGPINLFHYLEGKSSPPDEITLSPDKFGENPYTKNDLQSSVVPRVFFYTDPAQKETFFRSDPLYMATVEASSIYNLTKDPENYKFRMKNKNLDSLPMVVKDSLEGETFKRKLSPEEKASAQELYDGLSPAERQELKDPNRFEFRTDAYFEPANFGSIGRGSLDYNSFLEFVASKYQGAFYKLNGFSVVVWFEPITVNLLSPEVEKLLAK